MWKYRQQTGASSAGLLLPAPRFSKHLHGTASLFPDAVKGLPYWFVDNHDGTFSPASWEEMAATEELDQFDKVFTWPSSPEHYGVGFHLAPVPILACRLHI